MSKDPERLVVMHRQNVIFFVTGVGSKEQRDMVWKYWAAAGLWMIRVKLLMTRKIENEIDGLHAVIVRIAAAPQIKATVFKTLSVTQKLIVLRVQRVERWKILILS